MACRLIFDKRSFLQPISAVTIDVIVRNAQSVIFIQMIAERCDEIIVSARRF
jgi:hypothetical protein